MARLSFMTALFACLSLAALALGKSVDDFVQVEKRSPIPVADPGAEVPVELKFAGMVKRQSGQFQPPTIPADATNPAIAASDVNTFDDSDFTQGTGVNQIKPFAGGAGNKERKRAIWDELDPAVRKRSGLDVNLVSHDKATRGLPGGLIEII